MGWWLGLIPATLEFFIPNERNQGKQAHTVGSAQNWLTGELLRGGSGVANIFVAVSPISLAEELEPCWGCALRHGVKTVHPLGVAALFPCYSSCGEESVGDLCAPRCCKECGG
jgi:hypothetical protein